VQRRAQLWTNGPSFSIFAHPPRPRNPNHVPRGGRTMIAAPRTHVAPPSRSHRSGRRPSTIQSQQIDATMYTPPYAAYARPAAATSTRVSDCKHGKGSDSGQSPQSTSVQSKPSPERETSTDFPESGKRVPAKGPHEPLAFGVAGRRSKLISSILWQLRKTVPLDRSRAICLR
jgi:hypothetical protein